MRTWLSVQSLQFGTTVVLLLLVLFVISLFAAEFIRPRPNNRWAIHETKTTRIADVPDGTHAKIAGRVGFSDEPLRGPVSGRPCVAYSATIEYVDQHYDHRIIREGSVSEFVVRDEQGGKSVVSGPMILLWEPDASMKLGGSSRRMQGRLARFLSRHGFAKPSLDERRIVDRCSEAVVMPGDQVFVIGVAHWEPDPAPDATGFGASGYRETPMRLSFAGDDKRPTYVFRIDSRLAR